MVERGFDICDNLIESNKVAKFYCKRGRLIIGFKTLQEITINNFPYKKIKGIDIDMKSHKVELGTEKESIKLLFNQFNTVNIDGDINIRVA